MSPHKSLVGMRFGRLIVTDHVGYQRCRGHSYLCKCDCGSEVTVLASNLTSGRTRGCGCLMCHDTRIATGLSRSIDLVEGTKLGNLSSAIRLDNISGCKGVHWLNREQMYIAYITISKKRIVLGYFHDFDEAVKARKKAEDMYFMPMLEKYRGK